MRLVTLHVVGRVFISSVALFRIGTLNQRRPQMTYFSWRKLWPSLATLRLLFLVVARSFRLALSEKARRRWPSTCHNSPLDSS